MKDSIRNSIDNARSYFGEFSSLAEPGHLSGVNDRKNLVKLSAAGGLICFCFTDDSSTLEQSVAERVKKASYLLKGFAGLVTSKIFSLQREHNGDLYGIPIEDMIDIVKNLPVMSFMEPAQYQRSEIITIEELSAGLVNSLIGEVASISITGTDAIAASLINSIRANSEAATIKYNFISLSGIINISGEAASVNIETIFRLGGISIGPGSAPVAETDSKNEGIVEKSLNLNYTANEFSGTFDFDTYENNINVQKEINELILDYELDAVKNSAVFFSVPPIRSH